MKLVKFDSCYINIDRIDGIAETVEAGEDVTDIYVGGSETPFTVKMSLEDVVQKLIEEESETCWKMN